MKYVITNKVPLVPQVYTNETLAMLETDDDSYAVTLKEFLRAVPAPQTVQLSDLWSLNRDQFQALSLWICRGTKVIIEPKEKCIYRNGMKIETVIPGSEARLEHPRPEYHYSFVDYYPKSYQKRGLTSPQACYEHGQKLIAKVNEQNRIPFNLLESAYKELMRACITSKVYATCPNEKTYIEVNSQMQLEKEIQSIIEEASEHGKELAQNTPPEKIEFYARVFGIQLPDLYVRLSNIKTNHGYAVAPYITFDNRYSFVYDGGKQEPGLSQKEKEESKSKVKTEKRYFEKHQNDKRAYAGMLDDNGGLETVPYSLQRESIPVKLHDPTKLAKLAEMVEFFLNLPEEEMITFIADGFGYCPKCKTFYEDTEGCPCGFRKSKEEEELDAIANAYRENWKRLGW